MRQGLAPGRSEVDGEHVSTMQVVKPCSISRAVRGQQRHVWAEAALQEALGPLRPQTGVGLSPEGDSSGLCLESWENAG